MVSSPDDKGLIMFGGTHWIGTWNLYNGTYPTQFLELRYGDNQWRKLPKSLQSQGKFFSFIFIKRSFNLCLNSVLFKLFSKVWPWPTIVGIYFPRNENTKSKECCYKHFALDFSNAQSEEHSRKLRNDVKVMN